MYNTNNDVKYDVIYNVSIDVVYNVIIDIDMIEKDRNDGDFYWRYCMS
jgi:hypothetical protein